MATATFSYTFPAGTTLLDTTSTYGYLPTVAVTIASGGAIPSDGTIKSGTWTLTNAIVTKATTFKLSIADDELNVSLGGSASFTATGTAQTLQGGTITASSLAAFKGVLTRKVQGYATDLTSGTGITIKAGSGGAVYSLVITYDPPMTACTAPTSISLSNTSPVPGVTVALNWSGAKAGTNNAISGYEIQRSTNGTSWSALATQSNTGTSGTYNVTAPTTNGSSYYYRIRTQGAGGSSYYSAWSATVQMTAKQTYTYPTACTISLSKTQAEAGENVTLSWTGAKAGTNNPIGGYLIYYQLNGLTWVLLTTVSSSATSGSYTVQPEPAVGATRMWCIRVQGSVSGWVDDPTASNNSNMIVLTTVLTRTACGAPTAVTVTPNPVESALTLAWDGASDGANNPIVDYRIQYRTSADGKAWTAWAQELDIPGVAPGGSYTPVNGAGWARGTYLQFQVRARGTFGVDYNSAFAESPAVLRNSLPVGPESLVVTPAVWSSGDLTIAIGACADPDGNWAGVQLEYCYEDGVWRALDTVTEALVVWTPDFGGSAWALFRARAVDALGAVAAEYTLSNPVEVAVNTGPEPPVIVYPPEGCVCYNAQPRALVVVGADAEGDAQTLAAEGYTASREGLLLEGAHVVFQRAEAMAEGVAAFAVAAVDTAGAPSEVAERGLGVAEPSYTQPVLTPLVSPVLAVDITELRAMVADVCAYYGVSVPDWDGDVVALETPLARWTEHVQEIREAVEAVAGVINGWDEGNAVNGVAMPPWIEIAANCPLAAVMAQLREAVEML